MARSIHTTWLELDELKRWQYSDSEKHSREIETLRNDLRKKSLIKSRGNGKSRKTAQKTIGTSVDLIEVVVRQGLPQLKLPASPEDFKGVFTRLPKGVIDGLIRIDLGLDTLVDLREESLTGAHENKSVTEIFRGVWVPEGPLGRYHWDKNSIWLSGYLYADDAPLREIWEIYLKLKMLSALTHEIAHHYDWTMRRGRDRWLMDDDEKREIYAETMQYEWLAKYVIPYLIDTYPEQCESFKSWLYKQAGVPLGLEVFAQCYQRRMKTNQATGQLAFLLPSHFEKLVDHVLRGEHPHDYRVQFAHGLYYADLNAECILILDSLISEGPMNLSALSLKARVLCDQGKMNNAFAIVDSVLSFDAMHIYSLETLADLQRKSRQWGNLLSTTEKVIGINGPYPSFTARANRALALLHLARREEYMRAREEIASLGNELRVQRILKTLSEAEQRLSI